jgi:hypothetical protein
MNTKNKHFSVIFRFSKHENHLDFGFKKQAKKYFKKYENDFKSDYTENELIEFIEYNYSYAKIALDKYLSNYSIHTYTQQTLHKNLFKHDL